MMRLFGATLLTLTLTFLTGAASANISCDTDFNGDGVTDEIDFEILKNYIGATDETEGYTPIVDLNADGRIDMADLNAFLGCN